MMQVGHAFVVHYIRGWIATHLLDKFLLLSRFCLFAHRSFRACKIQRPENFIHCIEHLLPNRSHLLLNGREISLLRFYELTDFFP